MAASQQGQPTTDHRIGGGGGGDSVDQSSMSSTDAKENSSHAENLKEQAPSAKDEILVPSNISQDANSEDLSRDTSCHLGSLDGGGDNVGVTEANVCAPQEQPIFFHGYENATNVWEDYQYMNAEGAGAGPTSVYNENPSLVFHTGYSYGPQFQPYGPYSPVTTPLPSASGDSQMYSQQFPFTGPYYQQPPPPSMPYVNSPTPVTQADLTIPVEHQGAFLADNSNSNNMLFGSRPEYQVPYSPFGRGSFAGNSGTPGFYDLQQGFDGFGYEGVWSDCLKSPDGAGSLNPLSAPAASPQPVGAFGPFGQGIGLLSSGMASQQQTSMYGFGSSINSYGKGYFHGGMYQQGSNFGRPVPSLGTNGRSFIAIDKGRRRGKGTASLCSCNGVPDFLNEQNRGPRATRTKNAKTGQNSYADSKNENSIAGPDRELYNKPNFSTEHKDAKFFIIKSYSEDNVHKSIKYGVWASTANGNRKLDSAYREAKEREDPCPVFLFFSVNASSQFSGVAEMIGPVDFEKSVSYWLHDKWNGQFPVKWHIIKDVPNNLFRHIILENNDNKPVTNSRDTQEVKLEQGLEMLSIFKKHESDMSILDDFDFYEGRQKAMQESKARQQQYGGSSVPDPLVINNKAQNPGPISADAINQVSKKFDGVIRLDEGKTAGLQMEKNMSSAGASATAAETEDFEKSLAISTVGQNK